jgi:hypothetical protein
VGENFFLEIASNIDSVLNPGHQVGQKQYLLHTLLQLTLATALISG